MSNTILPELVVMQKIAEAVAGLSPAEKKRVAAWLHEYASDENEQVGYALAADTAADDDWYSDEVTVAPEDEQPTVAGIDAYYSFADLFSDVAPKTGAQKAVVAGYWLEKKEGQSFWKASEVNKLLKSIDVKVSSISIVLSNAVKSSKTMITELERLGDSERSRKTFRLNDDGIAYVEDRIA